MKITKIENQRNNPNRFSLFVDNEFFAGLDSSTVAAQNLYEGRELTAKQLDALRGDEIYYKCLNKAFEFLSLRLHSEKELKEKLSRKFDWTVIARALRRLRELQYLDDEVFAKAWVESRSKSRGKKVLMLELQKKGIAKPIIDEVVSASVSKEDELATAVGLISKPKFQNLSSEELFKKAGGFLARKGFGYDIIKKAIAQMRED